MTLSFSPQARLDLIEIGDYIAQDNKKRALTFVEEIESRCQQFEFFPLSGRPRPEIGPLYRSFAYGSYVIFYSVNDETLRIERILHGSRDISRHFS